MFSAALKKVCCYSCNTKINFKLINEIENTYFKSTRIKHFSISSNLNEKFSEKKSETAFEVSVKKGKQDAQEIIEKINYEVPEKDLELVERLKKGDRMYPYQSPADKISSIFSNDVKCGTRKFVYHSVGIKTGDLEIKFFPRETDILIIGGGALGVTIAYELRKKFPYGPKVIVIDRKSNFPHPSTNLGQGLLMQHLFTEEEEIKMSQYCAQFLSSFHRLTEIDGHPQFKVTFEPLGSLQLADEGNAQEVMNKSKLLKYHSGFSNILNNEVLKKKFPWLNLKNVLFGSLGLANEGLFDPWTFLNGIKCKAVNLGVEFITGEVIDFGKEENSARRVVVRLPDNTYNSIDYCTCILATGIETLNMIKLINRLDIFPFKVELPLVEKMRYEYCLYNPNGPGFDTPVVFDSDGTYFRREGLNGHYVAGVTSISNDKNEDNDIYKVFDNKVKPFLMNRIPQYENYELVKIWVDKYDTNTANEVGILGHFPGVPRFILANGFTHCGLQYVPAVARAVMELLLFNDYQTIDMKKFHIENLYHKQHLEADQKRRELLESQQYTALNQ